MAIKRLLLLFKILNHLYFLFRITVALIVIGLVPLCRLSLYYHHKPVSAPTAC